MDRRTNLAISDIQEGFTREYYAPSTEEVAAWVSRKAVVGLEETILEFKTKLPGWWYSVCECQVSCDASCAPTTDSPDIEMIKEAGDPFDDGFHADLPQPSTLAAALRNVMEQALAARQNLTTHKE